MKDSISRRDFLGKTIKVGAFAGLQGMVALNRLAPASAAGAKSVAATLQFAPDIQPLVALIENTSQGKIL